MTSRPRTHGLVVVAEDAADLLAQCEARLTRLQEEGFAVRIATPYSGALDEFAARGFETRPLPGRDRWNLLGRLGAYPILQADFLENPPTLVHGIGAPWAWEAAHAARQARVPAIVATIEGHTFDRVRTRAYRKLAQWVDGYIVHHEADLQALLGRGIGEARQFELLLGGRGVDLDALVPPETDGRRRQFAGDLTVAGDASEPFARLRQRLARTHPRAGWRELQGPGTQADLSQVQIRVSFDSNDVTGLALMAAAAMKVVTVAVDSPAARSVIVDHETGRIAPHEDEVAGIVGDLLGDPKRLADMAIRARARAERRFDRKQVDEQVLRIYDRLLSAKMT